MKECLRCGGKPILCEPNYADEGGTMVVCENCDFAGESFVLGINGEGRDLAVAAWDKANDVQVLRDAANQLEEDMRRYIFDKDPERRRTCLDRYRERLDLDTWAKAQDKKHEKAVAIFHKHKDAFR